MCVCVCVLNDKVDKVSERMANIVRYEDEARVKQDQEREKNSSESRFVEQRWQCKNSDRNVGGGRRRIESTKSRRRHGE